MLDLASLRKSTTSDDSFPQYFMELAVLRDPFCNLETPSLIYNTYFGPMKDVGYLPNNKIHEIPEGWNIVGMSEFEIRSRGIPFDDKTWKIFRDGGHVLWTWTPKDKLAHKRPQHSAQLQRLKIALSARIRLAELISNTLRDNGDIAGEEIDHHSNEDYFTREYCINVMGLRPNVDGIYPEKKIQQSGKSKSKKRAPTIEFFKERNAGFRQIYGKNSSEMKDAIKTEIFFYDKIYESNRAYGPKALLQAEFELLRILRNGYLRAKIVQKSISTAKEDVRTEGRILTAERQKLTGIKDHYDLSTTEYFLIALHSGLNPQFLHPKLVDYGRYLDFAVWLGQLGRSEHLELLPELCATLQNIITLRVPQDLDRNECLQVFALLYNYIVLFVPEINLYEVAQQTKTTGIPATVERRRFGLITSKNEKANKLSELLKQSSKLWALTKTQCDDVDFLFSHYTDEFDAPGVEIISGPYIPLAWQ
ncbi:hypothetical protein AFEL58S_03054 [Afipia felis]